MTKSKNTTSIIRIKPLRAVYYEVTIMGITPLYLGPMTEYAVDQVQGTREGAIGPKQKPLTMEQQLAVGKYIGYDDQGNEFDGYPTKNIKSCIRDAAIGKEWWDKKIDKKRFNAAFEILGDILHMDGECVPSKDWVMMGAGRSSKPFPAWTYRWKYKKDWKTTFIIRILPTLITEDSIFTIMNTAGEYIGTGAWRADKHGRFKIINTKKISKPEFDL